jgi:hypothetical protein
MLFWTLTFFVVAALIVGAIVLFQGTALSGVTASFFGPKAEKRLAVMEQASVDGRRRLVLVRRDNVEHLIMTGGPVDVVIETGIGAGRPRQVLTEATDTAPVFGRQARKVGHVVNE